MIFKSQISSAILVFSCIFPISIFAKGQALDYEHFLGIFAYEATPYWPEFEIVKDGEEFILKSSNSEWKMALAISDGSLIAKEDDGDEYKLSYELAKKHYIVSKRTQSVTWTGIQRFPEKRTMIKLMPNPNEKLEKEYGIRAADLVKKVRDSEEWIHRAKSLQIKAKDKWVSTPEGITHYRKELEEQFPDAEINDKRFSGLRPLTKCELHVVFDDTRFRVYQHRKDDSEFLKIWNGREYIVHEKYYTHDQENYAFRKEIPKFCHVLSNFMWPRSKRHNFWWRKNQMDDWEDFHGRAKEFILVGKQDYRGVPCYIIECYPKVFRRVRRWFVGIKDQLRYGDLVYESGKHFWEHWTGDYQEVKPGWWFSMSQGYHIFEHDENRNAFIASTRDIMIDDVQVDESLSDELFVMEFKEGVKVNDDRFGGFVVYEYKKDRTEEEWEEIRQKAQKRTEDDNAEKRAIDERIGQVAPEFPKECKWINTEPLTMEILRGKAIILQFWGIWCGPCHNYMGMLSAKPESEDIVIIGIHTPEDDLEKIQADLDKYKADGPVCVDVGQGWGRIMDWYRTKRWPYWIAIGPDGKVVGHSNHPSEIFQLARKAIEAASKEK